MANPEIVVEYVAKTTGLSKGMDEAGKSAQTTSTRLKSMGKAGVLAAGAAGLGALVATLKIGIGEMAESAKVGAQTEAVIKSTGGAAKVSADHVSELAGALMEKSGVDDEAIQSGENLLLTFTNIRNEAGKGNAIFDRATTTMLDMSVALGQDMKSSAVQLGKALNDPIKGITALSRVGVSFTEQQKKAIKAAVESGDTLKAQKIILQELNKEFGGSAEAAGKTLPGQLNILKESFNNLAGELVKSVAPAISAVAEFFTEHPKLAKAVMIAVLGLAAAFVLLSLGVMAVTVAASPWLLIAGAIVLAIAALIAIVILLVKNWDKMKRALIDGVNDVKQAALSVFNWFKSNWPLLLGIIAGPFGLAVGLIIKHWDKIEDGARALVGAIKAIFGGMADWLGGFVDRIAGIATRIANAIKNPINTVLRAWNAIEFKIPKISIPSVKIAGKKIGGGSIGGQTIPFPDIPLLAAGGIVAKPTLAMLGEAGPEAVLPLDRMPISVRVFIGDTELTGIVRSQVVQENNRVAQVLLSGARTG